MLLNPKIAWVQQTGEAYKKDVQVMQTCGGRRGCSDLRLKVSGGRIISFYLWLLSKPLSAHFVPSFPLPSSLWKLNSLSNAARAAKVRCRGMAGEPKPPKKAFCLPQKPPSGLIPEPFPIQTQVPDAPAPSWALLLCATGSILLLPPSIPSLRPFCTWAVGTGMPPAQEGDGFASQEHA